MKKIFIVLIMLLMVTLDIHSFSWLRSVMKNVDPSECVLMFWKKNKKDCVISSMAISDKNHVIENLKNTHEYNINNQEAIQAQKIIFCEYNVKWFKEQYGFKNDDYFDEKNCPINLISFDYMLENYFNIWYDVIIKKLTIEKDIDRLVIFEKIDRLVILEKIEKILFSSEPSLDVILFVNGDIRKTILDHNIKRFLFFSGIQSCLKNDFDKKIN